MKKKWTAYFVLGLATLLNLAPSAARGQTFEVGQALQPRAAVQQPPVAPRLQMPAAEDLLALIRTTIVALNHANLTGNYTVLRDLAAPDFRNANDAARLALIFQVLREQKVDLTPLLNIAPELTADPAIDAQGLLRLAGAFPTVPLKVNFDLSYQFVAGTWRPYTLSVYLARVEAELQQSKLKPQVSQKKR